MKTFKARNGKLPNPDSDAGRAVSSLEAFAAEVAAFLEERVALAVNAGVPEELICVDPGIGFGKTAEHNFELLRRLDVLRALGRPVVIGFSRKSSLGRLLGDPAATASTGEPGGVVAHGVLAAAVAGRGWSRPSWCCAPRRSSTTRAS